MQATDYKVVYDGSKWQVTRLSDNTSFTATPDANDGSLNFDGLKVNISATNGAGNNDSFIIKPTVNAIVNMDLAFQDESKIAMAASATSGHSDNVNGQALLDLQKSKSVGGNKSFNDAYAALVSTVGSTTATLKSSSTTQDNVVTQLSNQQQSISGVNLDEEYGNLQRYQQYYLANAQVLQTASSLFDALLNIR